MKNYKRFALFSTLALAGMISGGTAAGQTAVSAPVAVQDTAPKPIWLKAEVIHFDSNLIIVRESADDRMVHSFTYAPSAQAQVQKALSVGGYQYGDKVKIRYMKGGTVALAIHGKGSGPKTSIPKPVAPLKPATPR